VRRQSGSGDGVFSGCLFSPTLHASPKRRRTALAAAVQDTLARRQNGSGDGAFLWAHIFPSAPRLPQKRGRGCRLAPALQNTAKIYLALGAGLAKHFFAGAKRHRKSNFDHHHKLIKNNLAQHGYGLV